LPNVEGFIRHFETTKNIAGLHAKVKIYSRSRFGGHRGMMDKTMLNWAAVV